MKKLFGFSTVIIGLFSAKICLGTTTQLINITLDDIDYMLSWAFQIISDFKLLWLVIIGIILGLTALGIIMWIMRGKE